MPPPPTRPAAERYDRRQQEVVETAAALFARRGFDDDLDGRARDATGCAAAALYHYIGSKQELLRQISGS